MFLEITNNIFIMSAQNQHDNYLVNSLTQVWTVCKEKTEYGTVNVEFIIKINIEIEYRKLNMELKNMINCRIM